jgi:hypothetical protein
MRIGNGTTPHSEPSVPERSKSQPSSYFLTVVRCLQVSQIKPRFALAYIRSKVDLKMSRQLLRSTTESGSPC